MRTAAWRPRVEGIQEVLHARLLGHSYPMHTHDSWTLLLVDDGVVRYDLDRGSHGAPSNLVTVLPPHIPHNGTPATARGLRKRVLYLDTALLGEELIGRAADRPGIDDPGLRRRVHRLHTALTLPHEDLEAESRLALIVEHVRARLGRAPEARPGGGDVLAHRLRDLLHARVREGVTLGEAAALLHAHPTHLVRAFTREFGMPPHRYLVSARVDLARRLLLDGRPPHEVATAAGFYDQPHLTRHFKRVLGVSPGRYTAGRRSTSRTGR